MTALNKPYSESCDQNRLPILQVIEPILEDARRLLEIGSGTGQHAVFFAEQLPHIDWQPSDRVEYLPGIYLWLQDTDAQNIRAPLELDVSTSRWPDQTYDVIFSANTCHIMHWHEVEAFIAGASSVLDDEGKLLIYGPFNYDGRYTSESNASFDRWLKDRDPGSGVRDFEAMDALASQHGLVLQEDFSMPANNRILYWRKRADRSSTQTHNG